MVKYIGVLTAVNGSCPWLKQPIPCDFGLYTNATALSDGQKLLPNTDITGKNIVILFVVNSFVAVLLALFLLADEALLLWEKMSQQNYIFYRRLVHAIDTLLHGMSDVQVAAGIAMLIVVTFHADCISAYHYDVVCYLMLMSLMTHILVFVNVPQYCAKNYLVGITRIITILAIFVLTWLLFKARDVIQDFPVQASSLAIMPAACFVGNDSSVIGSDYFASHNVTQILESTGTSAGSTQYSHQFIPLGVCAIFGLLFLIADSFSALDQTGISSRWCRKVTLCIRVFLTLFVVIIGITATIDYFNLKAGFEIDSWYVSSDEDTTSLSQLVTLALSIPSIFAVLKVFMESIDGPRGEKEVARIFKYLKIGEAMDSEQSSNHEMVENMAQNKMGSSYP
ncbi:hypothetical protein BP6252_11456 [Coleophoma cylindrospora]|uniref:Uncharacterized protein n=1 Tax=Coleophoma cylindrospora TaxID=1849047 RepID=A0A3D8QJN0_9HELO|nr:hypothetical protein BP6252_11456 [Coleophoma cylindrospora]